LIQNAVALHQLDTATAVANFFRQLGGALIVAIFGAIVLSGVGPVGRGVSFETIASAIGGERRPGRVPLGLRRGLDGLRPCLRFPSRDGGAPVAGSAAKAADAIVAD
jgi:hypothetical protein